MSGAGSRNALTGKPGAPVEASSSSVSSGKASYEEQKAAARQRKKLERAVADAEAEVAELESAVAILEAQMATPDGAADMTLYEKHARLKARLEEAENAWLEASDALNA